MPQPSIKVPITTGTNPFAARDDMNLDRTGSKRAGATIDSAAKQRAPNAPADRNILSMMNLWKRNCFLIVIGGVTFPRSMAAPKSSPIHKPVNNSAATFNHDILLSCGSGHLTCKTVPFSISDSGSTEPCSVAVHCVSEKRDPFSTSAIDVSGSTGLTESLSTSTVLGPDIEGSGNTSWF